MSISVMKKKKTVNRPPEHEPIHQIRTRGQKIFSVVNYIILGLLALICVLPFWYIICLSFSSNGAVMAGKVRLLPVEFNVEAYHFTGKGRQIRIYDDVNVRFILEDMFCKLRLNYGDQKNN